MAKKQRLPLTEIPNQLPEITPARIKEYRNTFPLLAEMLRGVTKETDDTTCGIVAGMIAIAEHMPPDTLQNKALWMETLSIIDSDREHDYPGFLQKMRTLDERLVTDTAFGDGVGLACLTAAEIGEKAASETFSGDTDEDQLPDLPDAAFDEEAAQPEREEREEEEALPTTTSGCSFSDLKQMLQAGAVTDLRFRMRGDDLVLQGAVDGRARIDEIAMTAKVIEELFGGQPKLESENGAVLITVIL